MKETIVWQHIRTRRRASEHTEVSRCPARTAHLSRNTARCGCCRSRSATRRACKQPAAESNLGRQPDSLQPVQGDALRVLQAYYQAIDAGNYPRAYTYWEGNGTASQQSHSVFVQGFASIDRVTLATGPAKINAAAGSAYTEVPVVVLVQQRDGSRQSFCGNYRLRRANVSPFDTFG